MVKLPLFGNLKFVSIPPFAGGGAAGLPEVFNPAERPWIKPAGADTPRIVEQINKCPSGALSFYYNEQQEKPQENEQELTRVEVIGTRAHLW